MKKVRDCYTKYSAGVDLVAPNASIEEVVQSVTRDPVSRSVFVVDEDKKLVGIIQAGELLRLFGARYVEDTGLASPREFMAQIASHLMGPPCAVNLDDDLERALKLAVQNDLHDIPVVDQGAVVGNLDCLEIITNLR